MNNSIEFDTVTVEFVCNRLREERISQGITVKEVSEISGLPQSTLSHFFRKPADNPSFSLVVAVAMALGLSIDGLVAEACGVTPEELIPPENTDDGAHITAELATLKAEYRVCEMDLERTKQMLEMSKEQVALCKAGLKERKPVMYGLCGALILSLSISSMYMILDALNPKQGLIRNDGISPAIVILCFGLVGTGLYVAHMLVNRRTMKKEKTDENTNAV